MTNEEAIAILISMAGTPVRNNGKSNIDLLRLIAIDNKNE